MGKNSKTATLAGGPGKKRPFRYPWDEWLGQGAGTEFRVVRGRDFGCSASVMSAYIRVQASRRGVGVSIRDRGDGKVLDVTVRHVRRAKVGAA